MQLLATPKAETGLCDYRSSSWAGDSLHTSGMPLGRGGPLLTYDSRPNAEGVLKTYRPKDHRLVIRVLTVRQFPRTWRLVGDTGGGCDTV